MRWDIVPLRKLITPCSKRNRPDLPLLSVVRDKGIIMRKLDKSDNHNIIPEDLSNYKVVTQGQFVINKMKAWQGSCGVSSFDGIVSPAYFVFDLNIENPRFFNYSIRSRVFIDEFNRISSGIRVDQWDLSIDKLKYIRFPLPPRDEQDQIVRFLDWKVSRINKLINAKRRQIELLREQKRAVVSEKMSNGAYSFRRLKTFLTESKVTVGKQFAEFDLLSLTKNGVIIRDVSSGKGKFPSDFDTYKIVRPGQIVFCLFDVDETPRTVGLSYNHGIITGAYDIFEIKGIEPKYLEYYFIAIDDVKGLKPLYTGLRKVVNKDRFLQIRIPFPRDDEQLSIIDYLDKQCANIDKFENKLTEQITLFAEYRTRLVSDVVTGKLDVRGVAVPEYEAVEDVTEDESESLDEETTEDGEG